MYIKVIASPGAKKESVVEKAADILAISVREPAERNLANTRIRELVAARYTLPLSRVRILSGHRSRSKMMSIDN